MIRVSFFVRVLQDSAFLDYGLGFGVYLQDRKDGRINKIRQPKPFTLDPEL